MLKLQENKANAYGWEAKASAIIASLEADVLQ